MTTTFLVCATQDDDGNIERFSQAFSPDEMARCFRPVELQALAEGRTVALQDDESGAVTYFATLQTVLGPVGSGSRIQRRVI